MRKSKKQISFDRALDAMHRNGAVLLNMHESAGRAWFIWPANVRVPADIAAKLLARADIKGGKDSLFPGLDQTYRMVR
jgi:hypothetical protein